MEGDLETPPFIGYKEFYGEAYGARKSYNLSTALDVLNSQYEKTGKKNILNMVNTFARMDIKVSYTQLRYLYVLLLHLYRYNKIKSHNKGS